MKVVMFIPIKLNNERLPNKNILPLNNIPMCQYLFNTVKDIDIIDEKYVYCSNTKIKEYMPHEIELKIRGKKLDDFKTKGLEIINSFVNEVDADIYVLAHVTQPFIKKESIIEAIEKVKTGYYDSAFSAKELRQYCWYDKKPVNYNPDDIVRTQDLKPIYMETGAFYIFTKNVYEKKGNRIGYKPYIKIVDDIEAIDIDTKADYDFANYVSRYISEKN